MQKLLRQMKWLNTALASLLLCSLFLIGIPDLTTPANAVDTSCLHTSGSKILDSSNKEVGLSGLNWFGFETASSVPHVLWTRNWKSVLNQIKRRGYNVIRLPFSNAMLK